MHAYFAPEQMLHDPKQFMWQGRLTAPKDIKERTDSLLKALLDLNIPVLEPEDFGKEPLLLAHDHQYIDFLENAYDGWSKLDNPGIEVLPSHSPYVNASLGNLARPGCRSISPVAMADYYLGDLSSPMGPHTWESALRSAHSAVAAARAVVGGDHVSYALCRPSGHHVKYDCAAGFCYLNNGSIAAEQLLKKFERIAIIDVDVHHGDGTQQIFYQRNDVYTVSLHADPIDFFPFFTGYADEIGYGAGVGFNLNIPLLRGTADKEWLDKFSYVCEQVRAYQPQALIISLGFDAHKDDPLGVLNLTDNCFYQIGQQLADFDLPTAVIQEGGYAVSQIGDSLQSFISGLIGDQGQSHE